MVGICFGHQIISSALGGKVERMAEYLAEYNHPLFLGKEFIQLSPEDEKAFFSKPYVKRALFSSSKTPTEETLSQDIIVR